MADFDAIELQEPSPSEGPVGTHVTMPISNLPDKITTQNLTVKIGTVDVSNLRCYPGGVVFLVPPDAELGRFQIFVTIVIRAQSKEYNGYVFEVTPPDPGPTPNPVTAAPTIAGFNPTKAKLNSGVRVIGTNLESVRFVYLGKSPGAMTYSATINFKQPTELLFFVPAAGITPGNYYLTISGDSFPPVTCATRLQVVN